MKRAALTLLAAIGAGVALGPGPAGAGESSNDTVVTSELLSGGGYKLVVTAAPGQANALDILITVPDTKVGVRDTEAGITDDSSKCRQESETQVRCVPRGLRRVVLGAGDKNDVMAIRTESMDACGDSITRIKAGPGSDVAVASCRSAVNGGGGPDTLRGRLGNQELFGGRGRDRITGGRGNNDHCDGDGGNDSGGAGCETKISL